MTEPGSSRAVRWAQAVVNGMDAVTGTVLLSMETIGADRKVEPEDAPRLAGLKKATSRAARGVKWSIIAVVVIGIFAMIAVVMMRPSPSHPPASAPAPVTIQASPVAQRAAPPIAAVIRLKCAKGAYRDLPEIQASACGKPSTPAKGEDQ